MQELNLSNENFQTDLDINLKNTDIHKIGKWITDGAMAIDTEKVYCNLTDAKETSNNIKDYFLQEYLNDDVLNKVLKTENRVIFLPCAYKGFRQVKVNGVDELIDAFYAGEIEFLEVFYFNQTFYFFEYLESIPEMGIKESSYMLLGLVRGIRQDSVFIFKVAGILHKLNEYLEKLESEV